MLNNIYKIIVGCTTYNILATEINNFRYKTIADKNKYTMFKTPFPLFPIAYASTHEDISILSTDFDISKSKWEYKYPSLEYPVWCMPTFSFTPTIIYNIDHHAKTNRVFLSVNLKIID